ncbi:MAG: hypothetical protein H7Z13_01800 [Ferruginibacter sp.]|nr:hypothetical protein [Ferruginibacter sp.]
MKMWMKVLAVLLIALYILIGYTIPDSLFINRITNLKTSSNALKRVLAETKYIEGWWPKAGNKNNPGPGNNLMFKKYSFLFKKLIDNSIAVLIIDRGDTLKGKIGISKITTDTTTISWSCTLQTKHNSFTNIYYYYKAQKLSKIIDELLVQIKQFVENTRLLYGYAIHVENLTDNIVTVCNQIAAKDDLYHQLQMSFNKMNAYISKNKLAVTGNYMVNLRRLQNDSISIMTGIPTNTYALPEGNINYMQMPLGGNMVTAMHKGIYTNREMVYAAMEQFISDNELSRASLPFEKLVNNQIPDSDSSAVELKLYYPVF